MTDSSSPASGTPPQQRGYDRFAALAIQDRALEVLHALIRLDELDFEDAGSTWGVTAFPSDSKATILRLNCGGNFVADVKAPGGLENLAELRLYTARKVAAPFTGALSGPMDMARVEYQVTAPLDRALDLIADPAVASAHRELVDLSRRSLPNLQWHNPLLDQLLVIPV